MDSVPRTRSPGPHPRLELRPGLPSLLRTADPRAFPASLATLARLLIATRWWRLLRALGPDDLAQRDAHHLDEPLQRGPPRALRRGRGSCLDVTEATPRSARRPSSPLRIVSSASGR